MMDGCQIFSPKSVTSGIRHLFLSLLFLSEMYEDGLLPFPFCRYIAFIGTSFLQRKEEVSFSPFSRVAGRREYFPLSSPPRATATKARRSLCLMAALKIKLTLHPPPFPFFVGLILTSFPLLGLPHVGVKDGTLPFGTNAKRCIFPPFFPPRLTFPPSPSPPKISR